MQPEKIYAVLLRLYPAAFREDYEREMRMAFRSVGATTGVPMGGGNTSMSIVPVERPPDVPEQGIQAAWRWASDEYLHTLAVPLRRGRFFDASDSKRTAIILSEGLVRRLWRDGTDPIDRQVKLSNGRIFTVVGVVGDVRLTDLRAEPQPAMYLNRLPRSLVTGSGRRLPAAVKGARLVRGEANP